MSADFSQVDAHGRLRHLVTLDGLPRGLLEELLERAERHGAAPAGGEEPLRGWTIAHLFGEPSTRTRASFELAALRLGAHVLHLDQALSSLTKGETLADTVRTLEAMRVDAFVVRDREPGLQQALASEASARTSVISAGEAHLSHPTQGLLDALTIRQCKGRIDGLAVAIVGDIARSRVARSVHRALTTLGSPEIRLVAPPHMMPRDTEFDGAGRFESLDRGIAGADVVMMLRIQRERGESAAPLDLEAYHRDYGLTAARLARADRSAIVMHPGPMNRGVEIDSAVADGPQSVILRQVANGVAVRMAVLAELAAARGKRGA
jgi:aspartate carbamoyltransferase catalytic subunit